MTLVPAFSVHSVVFPRVIRKNNTESSLDFGHLSKKTKNERFF